MEKEFTFGKMEQEAGKEDFEIMSYMGEEPGAQKIERKKESVTLLKVKELLGQIVSMCTYCAFIVFKFYYFDESLSELNPGVRVMVRNMTATPYTNKWTYGLITEVKSKPQHRHFIKWDCKDGSWVDLGIETWALVDEAPVIEPLVKHDDKFEFLSFSK